MTRTPARVDTHEHSVDIPRCAADGAPEWRGGRAFALTHCGYSKIPTLLVVYTHSALVYPS